VWPRRQEVQQMLAVLTPMEGVNRMNTIMVRNFLQRQRRREGKMRKYSYTIDIDRRRNCYSYGEFSHLVRNCRNKRINASTITPSCISIFSSPIFTITSLNISSLSRL